MLTNAFKVNGDTANWSSFHQSACVLTDATTMLVISDLLASTPAMTSKYIMYSMSLFILESISPISLIKLKKKWKQIV